MKQALQITAKIEELEAKKPDLFQLQDETLKRYHAAKKSDPYASPREYYEACDQVTELATMIRTLKWVLGE